MPNESDQMVTRGDVLLEERRATLDRAAARLAYARALASDIKWQLSNGKVRQETVGNDEDLVHFWWIADCAPNHELEFNGTNSQNYWINPDSLDYISIPAHKFYVKDKKANDADQISFDKAAAKKKRGD